MLTEYMERLMSASLGDFWSEALLHPTDEDFPFKRHPDLQVWYPMPEYARCRTMYHLLCLVRLLPPRVRVPELEYAQYMVTWPASDIAGSYRTR